MFLTIILCSCVILVGYLFFRKPNTTGGKKLPGPLPLPLLGNVIQIGFQPHVTFTKWAKRYGPMYAIKIRLEDAIVITDYKLIKELFNESAATGRMNNNAVATEFTKGPHGIINSDGPNWEEQRRFTLRTLRSFGFAKSSMETMIMDEVQTTLDWFRKQEGSPISGVRIFNAPVVNSLWRMVTGERCQWEESLPAIFGAMDDFYKERMNVTTNGLLFAPVLRFIAPNFFRWNQYKKSVDTMLGLIEEAITNTRKLLILQNYDYIDHHLFEIGNSTDPKSSFYKETGNADIIAGVFDLFFAGSETLSGTLSWILLYLSEHTEIQNHLQKEIDSKVGSRSPSLVDRVNMPYSEAVISEILRISTIAAVGIPHAMLSDFTFKGYHLPKEASVIPNIYGVHHDLEIWGDPETFRPERFLNEDGTKFVPNDALIPFAEGKRKCIGESFGRDTLFLFLTNIFQQFNILPDPEKKGKADFEPDFGLLLGPKPFKVAASSRKG